MLNVKIKQSNLRITSFETTYSEKISSTVINVITLKILPADWHSRNVCQANTFNH